MLILGKFASEKGWNGITIKILFLESEPAQIKFVGAHQNIEISACAHQYTLSNLHLHTGDAAQECHNLLTGIHKVCVKDALQRLHVIK